ncbi:MAG: hypothetical protein AAF443_09060 [Chlamydiota bacterium]
MNWIRAYTCALFFLGLAPTLSLFGKQDLSNLSRQPLDNPDSADSSSTKQTAQFSLSADEEGRLLAIVKELPPSQWHQEVEAIDQAIEVLTDLRNKELARAARAEDQGNRLQFQFPNLIDARRAWAEADKSRAIAARYQEEIDKLTERKQEILRQHGKKISSYEAPA